MFRFRNPRLYVFLLLLTGAFSGCQSVPGEESPPAANLPDGVPFFLGTYDDPGVHPPGVYSLLLHTDGSLTNLGRVAQANNPSYLAHSPDRTFLIAVEELDQQTGNVVSFAVQGDTLVSRNRRPSGGIAPCHVAVDDAGLVSVSNYSSGTLELLRIGDEGKLSGPSDLEGHDVFGASSPHAHSSYFINGQREVIAADLGTDELWHYLVDREKGDLVPADPPTIKLEAGAGPRHLAVHPDGRWIYAINELNSSVTQLTYDEASRFTVGESWSTLPPDYAGDNYCADIHISADGKYLYGSNRGHNSIAVFAIRPDNGALEPVEHESVAGDWPRNFSLSPDESYLLVANQRSKNITTLRRDAANGTLEYVTSTDVPVPACILF